MEAVPMRTFVIPVQDRWAGRTGRLLTEAPAALCSFEREPRHAHVSLSSDDMACILDTWLILVATRNKLAHASRLTSYAAYLQLGTPVCRDSSLNPPPCELYASLQAFCVRGLPKVVLNER